MSLSRLLALFPYGATVLAYYKQYRRLFRGDNTGIPVGWVWDLLAPLLVASLTPLALAGKSGLPERTRLELIAVAAGAIFCVIVLGSLLPEGSYFRVAAHVGGERELRWLTGARLLLWFGLLIVAGCAAVNLVASGQ